MNDSLLSLKKNIRSRRPVTLDFVGDSITWGLNHCSPEETFVAEFARLFAGRFRDYKVVRYDGIVKSEALPIERFEGPIAISGESDLPQAAVIRNGVGGNTVRRAINRQADFTGEMPNGKSADVIFLMFGINDALRSDKSKFVTPDRFEKDYEELLSVLKKEEALPVVLSPTYNGVNYPLDDYANATERVAARHAIPFVDTHKLWLDHYDKALPLFGQGDWLASETDGCHFSPEGARQTARFIFARFCDVLGV